MDLPSLVGNGWVITDGDLKLEHTILGGVPTNKLELVSCRCQKDSKTNLCACRKDYLACTDACMCHKVKIEKTVDFSNDDDIDD